MTFSRATGDMRNVQPFWIELNLHIPGKGYSLSVHTEHVEMQVYVSEKGRVVQAYEPRSKHKRRYEPCGRVLVGQGGDTWDPICVLPDGHDGSCKSGNG